MRNSTANDYMFCKSDEAMGKTAVFPALHHAAKHCVDRPGSLLRAQDFSRTDRAEA